MDILYELDAWAHSQLSSAGDWLEYSKDFVAELVGPVVAGTVWHFAEVCLSVCPVCLVRRVDLSSVT